MHELPVAQNILEIVLQNVGDAKNVKIINITIGELSAIIGDSVQFYWDLISKDTVVEGATLNFDLIKTRFFCNNCKQEYEPVAGSFECVHCEGKNVKIIAGKEFQLTSIEVD
jgi:hydrogenase nickel incorporation protein HypA/HybF